MLTESSLRKISNIPVSYLYRLQSKLSGHISRQYNSILRKQLVSSSPQNDGGPQIRVRLRIQPAPCQLYEELESNRRPLGCLHHLLRHHSGRRLRAAPLARGHAGQQGDRALRAVAGVPDGPGRARCYL